MSPAIDCVRPSHSSSGCDRGSSGDGQVAGQSSAVGGEQGHGGEILWGDVTSGAPVEGEESTSGKQDLTTQDHEAETEEATPIRAAPTPELPSQEEIDRHQIDHIPYRSWCRFCLEGHGREDAHCASEQERSMPVVSEEKTRALKIILRIFRGT